MRACVCKCVCAKCVRVIQPLPQVHTTYTSVFAEEIAKTKPMMCGIVKANRVKAETETERELLCE